MIKVTIGITTYNLEDYIAEALDSVLCQKTKFKFKILVVDDCSTDKTPYILKDYQARYPDIIDIVLKDKNEGSLPSSNLLFENIKTEYFSFLDGDDYWVSENRLQEAIDFLDSHQDYSMYGANTRYLRDGKLAEDVIKKSFLNKTYSFNDYLKKTSPFVHTSAIVLRNIVYKNGMPAQYKDNVNTIYNCAFRGEDFRFIDHLRKGKLYVSAKQYSVYRIHSNGIWQGASQTKQILEGAIAALAGIEYFPEAKELYKKRFATSYNFIVHAIQKADSLASMTDKEFNLLTGLLKELKRKKFDYSTSSKNKIKLKYRVIKMIYQYCDKKLRKKGIII